MAPRYNPPSKVQTREIPLRNLINRLDPGFEQAKHREIEYEFTGRRFFGDPDHRGAYSGKGN